MEVGMKTLGQVLLVVSLLAACADAGEIIVRKTNGDVRVRHGVAEEWNTIAVGDVLRPNDTMRTGSTSSATLMVRRPDAAAAAKTITLPPLVMVDVSDIRDLTQEELMLKLTMEKVRSSSYQWKSDDLRIPNAGVVHGGHASTSSPLAEGDAQSGKFLLNGTRVLYDNGYYATAVLKVMEVFRRYPTLGSTYENRLLLAEALEKANLRGEAITEYSMLSGLTGLTAAQQAHVQTKLQQLRK
jgi:hypothetical protein